MAWLGESTGCLHPCGRKRWRCFRAHPGKERRQRVRCGHAAEGEVPGALVALHRLDGHVVVAAADTADVKVPAPQLLLQPADMDACIARFGGRGDGQRLNAGWHPCQQRTAEQEQLLQAAPIPMGLHWGQTTGAPWTAAGTQARACLPCRSDKPAAPPAPRSDTGCAMSGWS